MVKKDSKTKREKKLNLKMRNNLTKEEQRALKEIQRNDKLNVHEFDQVCGFAVVTDDLAKEKID